MEQRKNHPWRLYPGIKQKATGQLALRDIKSTEITSNYKYCFAGDFNFFLWEVQGNPWLKGRTIQFYHEQGISGRVRKRPVPLWKKTQTWIAMGTTSLMNWC